jgi:hypothetical protein
MTGCCERCAPTGYRRLETQDPIVRWYVACCAELDEHGEHKPGWFRPGGRLGTHAVLSASSP